MDSDSNLQDSTQSTDNEQYSQSHQDLTESTYHHQSSSTSSSSHRRLHEYLNLSMKDFKTIFKFLNKILKISSEHLTGSGKVNMTILRSMIFVLEVKSQLDEFESQLRNIVDHLNRKFLARRGHFNLSTPANPIESKLMHALWLTFDWSNIALSQQIPSRISFEGLIAFFCDFFGDISRNTDHDVNYRFLVGKLFSTIDLKSLRLKMISMIECLTLIDELSAKFDGEIRKDLKNFYDISNKFIKLLRWHCSGVDFGVGAASSQLTIQDDYF